MRRLALIGAIALGLMAPLLTTPAANAAPGPVVPVAQFGMTVQGIAGSAGVPGGIGSIRLWDSGVRWAELQPVQGPINFAPLDRAVARARAAGIRDIEYVLGSTPAWAAVPSPAESGDLYGPGTSSHPASDSYYLDFLAQVVLRYKGVITSYEIWNESNLTLFYRGTPTQLATLTKSAYRVIKQRDPKAIVASPSWLLRYWDATREAQLKAMKVAGWPFDVAAVHAYPFATQGPDSRIIFLSRFKARMAALGAASRPIWDTEANFGDRRPGFAYRVYGGGAAAGIVARTYIDSLRLGIARTHWYSWDSHILGIDMTDALGRRTSAGVAFAVTRSWTVGYRWNGCVTAKKLTFCRLASVKGAKRSLVYSTGSTIKARVPKGAKVACTLDGRCRKVKAGQRINYTGIPQLIVGV